MILTIRPSAYDVFVGIDVDKKSYAATYLDGDHPGKSLKMPAHPESLYSYFNKRFPDQRVLYVYEAGPTGYGLHDYLVSQGRSCMMIHPGAMPKAPADRVKTNKMDSRKIAEQSKSGTLKGIRIPTDEYRQLRHLVYLRQQYARDLARIKQRIKSLLLFESLGSNLEEKDATHWTRAYIHALEKLPLNRAIRFKMDCQLQDLERTREHKLGVLRELRSFVREEEKILQNVQYLQSIPGIGFIVAWHVLAAIGDPCHMRNVRELGAHFGLVPSENSTGETIQRGPITGTGNSYVRNLLVESSWTAIRKDRELEQFYSRIRAKNSQRKGSSIAIVAVARKLTHRIYRVLKDGRPYEIR